MNNGQSVCMQVWMVGQAPGPGAAQLANRSGQGGVARMEL